MEFDAMDPDNILPLEMDEVDVGEEWKRRFNKILTLCIALIAISASVASFMSEEIYDEVRHENDDYTAGVFDETSHALKFSSSQDQPTIALKESGFYLSMYAWYVSLAGVSEDPDDIEHYNLEATRYLMLSKAWEEIFYEELTKLTGEEYEVSSELVMDQDAIDDYNEYLIDQNDIRVGIRDETQEHFDNAKDATKDFSDMYLTIMLFLIAALLAGLTLIPEGKVSKYLLLFIALGFYGFGAVMFGITYAAW